MGGLHAEKLFVAAGSLLEARKLRQHIAALEDCVDKIRFARQYSVVEREGFVESLQAREHHGAIEKRIEIARIKRNDPVRNGERLLRLIEPEQDGHQDRQ